MKWVGALALVTWMGVVACGGGEPDSGSTSASGTSSSAGAGTGGASASAATGTGGSGGAEASTTSSAVGAGGSSGSGGAKSANCEVVYDLACVKKCSDMNIDLSNQCNWAKEDKCDYCSATLLAFKNLIGNCGWASVPEPVACP